MKQALLSALFLLAFSFPSVFAGPTAHHPEVEIRGPQNQVMLGARFQVEVARTVGEWQKGLMFRDRLGKREGMFFFGTKEKPQSFWMKNTPISLDIIYISKDLRIVSIAENTTPFSEDPIPSKAPALHVLEIPGGVSKKLKLKEGDIVVLHNIGK